VADRSGDNPSLVRHGVLDEPDIPSALTGITRASIHHLADDMGLKVVSRRLTRDDLYIADEAFFTGTAAEVTPIREIDGRQIGAGERGPITGQLQKAFFDAVSGKTPKYHNWLFKV
jgi:branched-chain amino acid aminotransferase